MYAIEPIKECPHCEKLEFEKFIERNIETKCND
jgi:hypothetical protein